jgi:hypothetical protein
MRSGMRRGNPNRNSIEVHNRANVLDHLPALPYTLQRDGNVAWRAAPT